MNKITNSKGDISVTELKNNTNDILQETTAPQICKHTNEGKHCTYIINDSTKPILHYD